MCTSAEVDPPKAEPFEEEASPFMSGMSPELLSALVTSLESVRKSLANLSSDTLSGIFSDLEVAPADAAPAPDVDVTPERGTLPLADAFPILSKRMRACVSRESNRECNEVAWSGRGPRRDTRYG